MRVRVRGYELGVPQLVLLALTAVTGLALVVAASTSGAAFGSYNPAWDGAADLRGAARDAGATPTVTRDTAVYADVPADGTVAVVLSPDARYTDAEAARIERFVRAGGTLLVAEDFGPASNRLLASLNATARIDGRLLRDERFYYRAPALLEARNVTDHPLTEGVESLTLNYGTWVRPGNATVLVRTSGFAYVDADRDGTLDANETLSGYPVATAEPIGDGEVIVVGDPSAFINAMLDRPGNREFVRTLFARHDRVVLDYAHAGGVPPLIGLVLGLRANPPLQFLLGGGAVLGIAVWARSGRSALGWVRGQGSRRRDTDPPELDEAAVRRYVERRHPEWSTERVERVIQAIMSRRRQHGENERRVDRQRER